MKRKKKRTKKPMVISENVPIWVSFCPSVFMNGIKQISTLLAGSTRVLTFFVLDFAVLHTAPVSQRSWVRIPFRRRSTRSLYLSRPKGAAESVFIAEKRFNAASVSENNLRVKTTIKLVNT